MGSYLKEKGPRRATREQASRPREDLPRSRVIIGSDQPGNSSNGESKVSSNMASSQGDPGSHRRMTPAAQASRLPWISMDFVLPSAPIVTPSRDGVTLPYDEFLPGPFQSLGKPLDPFQSMFQSSQPRVSVEELKFYCSRSFGTKAMGTHWIPTVVQLPHTFLSTLCLASAHYDAVHERHGESVQTLALRQEVIHLINQNLLDPRLRGDDFNIVALTQLIASEIIAADETTLEFHETGIEAMIKLRGGLRQLGVNGRLASAISWISLASAILREAKPRTIYLDHCASTCMRVYPNTATIPESPLYCPRRDFESIKRSTRCDPKAVDLLKDSRMMIDLFLHESRPSRNHSVALKGLYKRIATHYPPASGLSKGDNLGPNGFRYEAIRVAAMLTATSIAKGLPLSEALKQVAGLEDTKFALSTAVAPLAKRNSSLGAVANPVVFSNMHGHSSLPFPLRRRPHTWTDHVTALLAQLKATLESSDLSDCWADMAGVLLWVALTAGAASHKTDVKVLKKWFKALAMRVSIVLCFEHPEAIHASLLRMSHVCEGVEGRTGESDESGVKSRRERMSNTRSR